MFDELFNQSSIIARYQKAPYAESRANFLKKARVEGHPPSMLERIAWTLLAVAQAVNFDAGSVTATELERAFGDEPVSRPQRIHPLMVAKAEVMAFLRAL
jgi:hypothetical protein